MKLAFKKAEKRGIYARIALDGVTGGGKTYTAIQIARGLQQAGRIALIDTEHSSAERYAPKPGEQADPENHTFDFDHMNLATHHPDTYIEALSLVDPKVYDVVIVDSLSHAWAGRDGALEQVDKAAARSQSNNKFTAWRDVTPMHNRLVDALLSVNAHLIVTMRSKMAYELVENDKGKKEPKRLGLAPVQREGIEYELDIVGDMNEEGTLVISKTRAAFLSGGVFKRPGPALGRQILDWCGAVDPSDATVTTAQLKELRDFGTENGKTVEEIQQLAQAEFGKSVREINVGELATLKTKIAALVTA